MEDYKKKLKEALDSKSTPFEVQAWIEEHFPSLIESEDERIRKSIIELLNEVHFTFKHYDINKMLAWLEKQGEQKPADKVEPIVIRDFYSVFSREQVEEIDKRIEESQRLYNAKLRDAIRKVEDFPMTD